MIHRIVTGSEQGHPTVLAELGLCRWYCWIVYFAKIYLLVSIICLLMNEQEHFKKGGQAARILYRCPPRPRCTEIFILLCKSETMMILRNKKEWVGFIKTAVRANQLRRIY